MKTAIEQMAREAGIDAMPADANYRSMYYACTPDELEHFATLVCEAHTKELLAGAGEPVATLWQHGETGRIRVIMPDTITDCDARWFKVADLYTTDRLAAAVLREREHHLRNAVRAVLTTEQGE